jgi:methionyl-tRNA synthetase
VEPLFSKIEEEKLNALKQRFSGKANIQKKNDFEVLESINLVDGLIDINEFRKVDLLVAKVLQAERVEGSEKLVKLKVMADKERQIIAGVYPYYQPQDLLGKKILIVANLKPARLKGELSEGMLLAAGEKKPKVIFAPENAEAGEKLF